MRSVFLAFCLSGFLAGCSSSPAEQPVAEAATDQASSPAPAQVDSAKAKTAEASFRAESQVIDLLYDPSAVVQWTIGVKDDGGSRIGYAEYFCLRLQQIGMNVSSTKVRIVDFRKFVALGGNGRDANLGTVVCATSQPFE